MIFAIDSVKTAKRAIAAMVGHPRMRTGCVWRREGNTNRINAMRCVSMQSAKQVERMTVLGRDLLRAARDIDMRKTSLDHPEPDGYMPSLFSTD
ncbi:hypothetical protein K7N18_10965 [Burkholderia arboris]|uniref:hypothetical protein n=1 Tax=Burkholderia arboris TaxID=488730 RepID=UPI001CA45FFC|nr:hypothetical protein [Burkholderia arboris]MBY8605358.1 hypothetical protein [Burkholderia arboris]